jgi:hypothetical protein
LTIPRLLAILALCGWWMTAAGAGQPAGKTMSLVTEHGLPPPANDWDLHVILGVIPGAFTGEVDAAPSMLLPASFGNKFTVPYALVERRLAGAAQLSWRALFPGGLTITPWNTRFLRVSTSLHDKKTGKNVMGGGFVRENDSNQMLTYFDRACTVKGDQIEREVRVNVDLAIPAPGLYWLHAQQTGPGVWQVRTTASNLPLRFVASRPRTR